MLLGWNRVSTLTAMPTHNELSQLASQADQFGYDQLWVDGLTIDKIGDLPLGKSVRIGTDLCTNPVKSPRQIGELIRAGQEALGNRLMVGLTTGGTKDERAAFERMETLLWQDPRRILPSDLPLSPPLPCVMARPAMKSAPDMRRTAYQGFQALSPAWQTPDQLARHWAEIVGGATHAARRACPSNWHLNRLIYVSENSRDIAAYLDLAKSYLAAVTPSCNAGPLSELVIAGSSDYVAMRISQLRRRIGPFGTLHNTDPGLDLEKSAIQMDRLSSNVMPSFLIERPCQTSKVLEKT